MPNVIRRKRRLRLPRRHVVSYPVPWRDRPFVVWTGLPFIKWLTGHDCLTIYDVVFAAPHMLEAETVAHEGEHVCDWRAFGFFGFIRAYLREQRRHGYDGNAFELHARTRAKAFAHLFSRLGA